MSPFPLLSSISAGPLTLLPIYPAPAPEFPCNIKRADTRFGYLLFCVCTLASIQDTQLDDIKASVEYDELEMSSAHAVWPEVLAIYAVKTTTDPDNPQEVASITDEKIELLRDIFWHMNEIDYETDDVTEMELVKSDDGNGNIVEDW